MAFSTFSSISNLHKKSKPKVPRPENTPVAILSGVTTSAFGMSRNGSAIVHIDTSRVVRLSTDNGESFTTKTNIPTQAIKVCISNNGIYILASSSSAVTYLSTNSGSNWNSISSVTVTQNQGCCMSDDGKYMGVSGSGTRQGYYVSNDYGVSWTQALQNKDAMDCSCSENGQYHRVRFYGTRDYTSSNNGVTFSDAITPTQAGSGLTNYQATTAGVYTSGDGLYYVDTNYDYRDVYTYNGTSWSRWSSTIYNLLNVSNRTALLTINYDGSKIYFIYNKRLYLSTDNMQTYSTLTTTDCADIDVIGSRNSKYLLSNTPGTTGNLFLTTTSNSDT